MHTLENNEQRLVCRHFGAEYSPPKPREKIGISRNAGSGQLPLNGMRHLPHNGTCGWYIWAGETVGANDDFFLPMHHEHLIDWCPTAIKFLGLPPGWRFLLADQYEDAWFDQGILHV